MPMSTVMEIGENSSAVASEAHEDYTDTLIFLAEESPPPLEEHLNIPTEERQNLLKELSAAMGTEKVPAAFWACVQVCDIDKLRELVSIASERPDDMDTIFKNLGPLIKMWKQRRLKSEPSSVAQSQNQSGAQSPAQFATQPATQSPNTRQPHLKGAAIPLSPQFTAYYRSRDPALQRLARQRDNNRCVFTKQSRPDAAHIYPECLIKAQAVDTDSAFRFWRLLEYFWTPKQIQLWRQEIFSNSDNENVPVDGCFNRICINTHIHRMWGSGLFALRPLEYNKDRSELEVEWYWQPDNGHKKDDLVKLTKSPLSSRDLYEVEDDFLVIKSPSGSFVPVKSGQRFTLKTSDPENLPLPSKKLLDLQWHLSRIVGMSGAAEGSEEDDYDDGYSDDDGGYAPLQDEHCDDIERWVSQSAPLPSLSTPPLPFSETGSHDESDLHQSFSSPATTPSPERTRDMPVKSTDTLLGSKTLPPCLDNGY